VFDISPISSNVIDVVLRATPRSDFDTLNATCTAHPVNTPVCRPLFNTSDRCSATIGLRAALGCDYRCSIATLKANYTSVSSSQSMLRISQCSLARNINTQNERLVDFFEVRRPHFFDRWHEDRDGSNSSGISTEPCRSTRLKSCRTANAS
jgi:hypothetical protein